MTKDEYEWKTFLNNVEISLPVGHIYHNLDRR